MIPNALPKFSPPTVNAYELAGPLRDVCPPWSNQLSVVLCSGREVWGKTGVFPEQLLVAVLSVLPPTEHLVQGQASDSSCQEQLAFLCFVGISFSPPLPAPPFFSTEK